MNQKLEDFVLSTLSFYEPMSFSRIVFDMDGETLKQFPEFDKEQLMTILSSLEKRGVVKKSGSGENIEWIRIHKKRSIWKRFFPF